MTIPSGREIVLTSSSFSVPTVCASCLGAPAASVTTKKRKGIPGRGSETLSIEVPYCGPCAARAKSAQWKEILVTAAVVGVAALGSSVAYVAPGLAMPVVVALGAIPALAVAILAMTVLRPKRPGAPATAAGEAVRITAFEGTGKSTLYCTNGEWADRFIAANGVYAHGKPKARGERFALAALPLALLAGPGLGYEAFSLTHPYVYVDNASADTLQIYVDGVKRMDVGANRFETMRVGRGKHTFGYSKPGESAPSSTAQVEVKVLKAHLYNPGRSACYWLVAASYGTATVNGVQRGPQPITEFYRFDKVDHWFGDNPQWLKVDKKSGGGTQVALQRSTSCMTVAARGCSTEIREQLVECQQKATDDAALDACMTQADLACGGGTAAKAASPAAPTPKAASKAAAPAGGPMKTVSRKK